MGERLTLVMNLRGGVWEVGISSTVPGILIVGTGSVGKRGQGEGEEGEGGDERVGRGGGDGEKEEEWGKECQDL